MFSPSCAYAEARRRQLTRLGLLDTRFTMEADFFKAPFRASPVPCLDTMQIHIRALIDAIHQ